MHQVPCLQEPLLPLHDEQTFAREDEEVLLRLLRVVHAARLARPQDANAYPELGEACVLSLERRVEPEPVALEPPRIAHVEDEPALTGWGRPVLGPLERGLRHHRL